MHFIYRGNTRHRHEPKAPSPSRHRCRLRVVRVNKKSMPDKIPGTGFFIAAHHPGVKVRLGRFAFCFIVPAPLQGASALACADRSSGSPQCGPKPLPHPSVSGCAGSRCAAPFPLTCHTSHPLAGRVCAGRRTPFRRHTACRVKPLLNPQGAP